MLTIEQAKEDIRQGWKTPTGAVCPCCGQLVKLYKRQIYNSMAYHLIKLYRLGGGYHHMATIGTPKSGGGDFSKLKYWGLVEQKPDNDDPTKKTSGYWRITKKGALYVEGDLAVPKYCFVYNKIVCDFSSETKNIVDALGDKFDYRELMGYLI